MCMGVCGGGGVWGIEIRKYHNVELFLSYHLAVVVYIFGRDTIFLTIIHVRVCRNSYYVMKRIMI